VPRPLEFRQKRHNINGLAKQGVQVGSNSTTPDKQALMHAFVRFAHIPAANTFGAAEIYPHIEARQEYRLNDETSELALATVGVPRCR
jgi:hypothetical protein